GTVSPGKTVTVSNYGTAALTVNSATVSGDFAVTNSCPKKVNPGKVCTMTVTFAPSSTGTRPGTLTVSDTDSTSPQTVTLQGNGTNAALSPSLLKFLNTVPGKSSATMTATLTN